MEKPEAKINVEQTLHEIAKFHFILEEGKKGNHLLFDSDSIRQTFLKEQAELLQLFQEKLDEINQALNQTFSLQGFAEKREYIRALAPDIRNALIFGYFQLLEGDESEPEERLLH